MSTLNNLIIYFAVELWLYLRMAIDSCIVNFLVLVVYFSYKIMFFSQQKITIKGDFSAGFKREFIRNTNSRTAEATFGSKVRNKQWIESRWRWKWLSTSSKSRTKKAFGCFASFTQRIREGNGNTLNLI